MRSMFLILQQNLPVSPQTLTPSYFSQMAQEQEESYKTEAQFRLCSL